MLQNSKYFVELTSLADSTKELEQTATHDILNKSEIIHNCTFKQLCQTCTYVIYSDSPIIKRTTTQLRNNINNVTLFW